MGVREVDPMKAVKISLVAEMTYEANRVYARSTGTVLPRWELYPEKEEWIRGAYAVSENRVGAYVPLGPLAMRMMKGLLVELDVQTVEE